MKSGSAVAARAWARVDLRARWRSLVAVGVIAGVTAGVALGALAGARSTDTALARLRERTNASDAIVFASQAGAFHPDWSALEQRPEVRNLAIWALVFGALEGEPEGLFFTPVDDEWMQDVDAPVVIDGRMFDPAADNEIVVADDLAASEGIHVGDTIGFTPYTPDEIEGTDEPLKGPRLEMHVVGVVRTPLAQLFVQDGFAVASPGLITQHDDVNFLENAFVQLRGHQGDAAALEAHVNDDVAAGTTVLDLNGVARRVTTTTDVERAALVALAFAVALAGLVLAGQVVARSAGSIGHDARVLRAVGMRRVSVATAPVLSHALSAVVAAATCVTAAVVLSLWLPMGLAGRLEPNPGARLDAAVVLPGTAALVIILLGGVFLAAYRAAATRPISRIEEPRGIGQWLRRHAGATVGLGATMAFHGGRGRRGVPVRPALAGAIVGVLGVATAITMDAGLRDALDHPERAGVAWDGTVAPGSPELATADGMDRRFVDAIRGTDGVADIVQVDRIAIPVGGATGLGAFALRELDEPSSISLVTLAGRPPERRGEAALGPETAESLGLDIGDTVKVGEPSIDVEVVGTALFPNDVHGEFDEGVWLTAQDLDRVASDEGVERSVGVRFVDGVDEATGVERLSAATTDFDAFVTGTDIPPELANLRNVLPLPKLLAAFLALLAVAALLHVLASTVRVRAHDFAVLRAIGLTRRSVRLVVNVQGTAMFVAGLIFGLPLGLALGRAGWRFVAASVPLEQVSPFAIGALALLVPAALLVAQATAFAPSRRVSRLRPAEVLRTE